MNILIATNSYYLMPTKVMISSLIKNNKNIINFYLLQSDLKQNELLSLKDFITKFKGVKLITLDVNTELFSELTLYDHLSKESFYRLLAHEILPGDIERVLYLDGDIIINNSIEELYNMSFIENGEEKSFIVCEGKGISKRNYEIYDNLAIPHDTKYFNSGVMLMNLKKLRDTISINEFFSFITNHKDRLLYHDQDVLNGLFYDDVKYVNWEIYNKTILHIHSKKEENETLKDAKIIHYAGSDKPWNYNYMSWLFDTFWTYAKEIDYDFRKLYVKTILRRFFWKWKNRFVRYILRREVK